MIYQSGAGSMPGGLLRMLLEEQGQTNALMKPQADPNTLTRETVQGPIFTPESPGSERVVSIRPEGVTQQGPEGGQVIAPVMPSAPGAGASPVIPPIVPKPPAIGTSIMPSGMPSSQPSQASRPNNQGIQPAPSRQPSVSQQSVLGVSTKAAPLSIGTRITAQPTVQNVKNILEYNKKNFVTPQPSSVGGRVVKPYSPFVPTPTPAPQQQTKPGRKPVWGGWFG